MKCLRLCLSIFALILISSCSSTKKKTKTQTIKTFPPIPLEVETKLVKHGETRLDPFFWMKQKSDPVLINHLNAENNYTEASFKPYQNLQNKLFEELKSRIKKDDDSAPIKWKNYEYWSRVRDVLQYPIHLRRSLDKKTETILVDVNQIADGKSYTNCTGPSISENENLLLYACDFTGRHIYTIKGKEISSNKDFDFEITNTTGNLEWSGDNNHFFFTRQDPETLRSHQVWRYSIREKKETLVYEEKDSTFSLGLYNNVANKFIFIGISSTLSTEVHYIEKDKPLSEWKLFHQREKNHEYQVIDGQDQFYILTNWKAKNFRIMQADLERTQDKANWKKFIKSQPHALIENVEVFKDHLVYKTTENGLEHINWVDRKGGKINRIKFEDNAYSADLAGNSEYEQNFVRYSYQSMRQPPSVFNFDFKNTTSYLVKAKEVPGFDPSQYKTERQWLKTRDGYKIPITILMHKNTKKNSTAPLLVYGYGAYGFSMTPWFSSNIFSLVDRGWVYALTHIRGGSELGRKHYEAGRTHQKMNTFFDFIDSTEYLVKNGYGNPKRVSASGGSAGGLLVGAVANLRPDLYHSVVAEVPFVDVLTTMLDETIPLTTSEYDEWGNPNIKKDYDYIRKYSPYDNIKKQNYPHILALTGLNDSQVPYWEPAKWVSKLRKNNTAQTKTFFKIDMSSGHGGASGRFDGLKDNALIYTFLLSY